MTHVQGCWTFCAVVVRKPVNEASVPSSIFMQKFFFIFLILFFIKVHKIINIKIDMIRTQLVMIYVKDH